ncbi:MAG: protease pro-enzyme activation domain-containing protein [Ktedonobacteraceae bacterium]
MQDLSRQVFSWRKAFLRLVAIMVIIPALLISYSSLVPGTAQAASGGKSGVRTVLPGHLVPALKHLTPIRATDGSRHLQLSISLQLRNQRALKELLREQTMPSSPYYHRYVTPQQFTALFGPTTDGVNKVVSYLRSQGIHVGAISSNRTLIDASASAATVERAFGITIADYMLNGRSVYAPTSEPSVPSNLASLMLNIGGLDNVARYRPQGLSQAIQARMPALGPGGGYTPGELRTAYDMNSLISSTSGTGQTVAIFELDGYLPSDVNTYLSQYSLGSAKYSNVLVDGATNTAGAGAIEVELDMEVVSAIAPGATQKIYIGPNSTSGVNDTYNKIVTDNIAKITTTSWGECESASGNSELAALDNIFSQGAAQGQATFAASGDAGAYDCGDTNLAVDSPASDPHVVGVGGTTITTGSGGTYVSETVWSNPNDTSRGPMGAGGGGGYSSDFSKPTYQTGPGVDSNTMRHVPDVSADADPNSGYSVYCTVGAAGCSSGSAGWIEVGGTSAAAPLWAAMSTDTNAYLVSQGKSTLGSVSADLYTLFNTSQTYTAYHDITTGNNLFYNAGPGYDVASGIGTPDAWNFARDAANLGGGGTNNFSISANPTSLSIAQGGNSTSTISTAVTSGSAGTVSLTAAVSPSGPTASLNPTSVTAGNSSTLTVSVGSSVPTGTYTVTVTGTEGSAVHSTTVTITVTAPVSNDFSISANPTSITIAQGSNGTSKISTAVTKGSAGTVNLTAGVSPSGPTASLNPTSVTAGNSSTLTVSVGSSVPAGTYTVTVTGTEGSAVHSTTVTITVTSSGGTQTQLLANNGFENGQSPWQESSTGGYQIVDPTNPHTGNYSAYLCGYDYCKDQIWQTVTLPTTTTKVVLSYWLYIDTNESGNTCYDYFYARIRNSSGATIATVQTKCNANVMGWTQFTFDVSSSLSSYHGKQVQVYFEGTTDSSLPTDFFVDDVTFTATHS